jgi:predicted permease
VVGAGLLVRSFARLSEVEPGFQPTGVLTFGLDLPRSRFPRERRGPFVDSLLERLRALPGVRAAGATSALPMTGSENLEPVEIEGRPKPPAGQEMYTDFRVVTPGYFAALGIPLVRGRTFSPTDGPQQAGVAVVSEALARVHWPGQDPIGRRLRIYEEEGWLTVVGVVGDVRHSGKQSPARPHLYAAYAQSPYGELAVAVRTDADLSSLAPALRAAVAGVDADLPLADLRTMPDVVAGTMAGRRSNMLLLAAFAGLALLLSSVGLYGVASHSVGQRTREMGLRMALGAAPGAVLRMVLRESLRTVLLGLVPGVLGALAAGRLLSGMLYGIPAADPVTFVGSVAVLAGVTVAASLAPGLRATRVDPMVTLRAE